MSNKIYRDDDIFETLYVQYLTAGDVKYPSADGSAGQVLVTDGSGNLSFSHTGIGDVSGPSSSTTNAIALYGDTTGKVIINSLVTINGTGKVTAPSLVAGTLTYPTADGTSGQVLSTNGSGVLSFVTRVSGPGSSTTNAIPRYADTTGSSVINSLVTIDGTGKVTAPSLVAGTLTYPTADGTSGQVLSTNGSGALSFVTRVSGPGSSTTNAIPRYADTTGSSVINSLVTIDGTGKVTAPSLVAGTLTYPTADGTSGQVLTTNGSGVLSFSSVPNLTNKLYGRNVTGQTSNLTSGNHVTFNSVSFSTGSTITLDTTSPYSSSQNTASIGRITLTGGKTYYMEAWIIQFTGTTLVVAWYDSDGNAFIDGPTSGNIQGCLAVYTPSSTTRVEVRITSSLLVTNINRSFVKIVQLN